ncbi:MAG TPA: helix-turn-helix domain-containing protein, partial [Spongiibacteraceae bacterium]|nr:helix-turn-helix domain-containing protein [Spongiibacteraceae bacterium]
RWITIDTQHLGLGSAVESHSSEAALELPESEMSLPAATQAFQRRWLENALRRSGDNLSAAARLAGMDRSNFHRLLKKMKLR